MRALTGDREVHLLIGDITLESVDAIVTSANSRWLATRGVDGTIHSKAGPRLREQLHEKYPEGCPVGSAAITMAYLLPSRYVIHAVGPTWQSGDQGEREQLTATYRRILELASEHECRRIALPAIGTGVHGYPLPEAANVALRGIRDFQSPRGLPEIVRFVLHDKPTFDHFVEAIGTMEGYEIDA